MLNYIKITALHFCTYFFGDQHQTVNTLAVSWIIEDYLEFSN